MNPVLISNRIDSGFSNLDSCLPEIVISINPNPDLEQILSRNRYQKISTVYFNPLRFASLSPALSKENTLLLQDKTSLKVIGIGTARLGQDMTGLLEEVNKGSNLQIVAGATPFDQLQGYLGPRGFIPDAQNQILVRGAQQISSLNIQEGLPLTRLDFLKEEAPTEKSGKTFLSKVLYYIKYILRMLFFKIVVKLIMAAIL